MKTLTIKNSCSEVEIFGCFLKSFKVFSNTKKYELLKQTSLDKYQKLTLHKKIKIHKLELEKCMSMLTVILINLKN